MPGGERRVPALLLGRESPRAPAHARRALPPPPRRLLAPRLRPGDRQPHAILQRRPGMNVRSLSISISIAVF